MANRTCHIIFNSWAKDPNFRIQVSESGVHIYNRDGLFEAIEPFALYQHLQVEQDASHAFYLGVELARAQIAWQLNKRYVQDQELEWGISSQINENSAKNKVEKQSHRAAAITARRASGSKA